MWLDQFSNYILFLLEAITIVVAILIVISGIVAIGSKGKKSKGKLNVKALHSKYKEMKSKLEYDVYEKKFLKKELKAQKKLDQEKQKKNEKDQFKPKRIYVINFKGDIQASQVEGLREEVTAILSIATPQDEVVINLESPGGVVHGYGLAASQLERIKSRHIPLTIIVDKVAASGGYMMASLGDKIVSAPFAIIGSVGVVAQLPNINRLLESHGVDVELHTAGEYKRTLTVMGKNTEEGRKKFKEDLDSIHTLFKQHIEKFRPKLDIEKVATGEYWFGHKALELDLVDELSTSDDYLFYAYEKEQAELFEVKFEAKGKMLSKLKANIETYLFKKNIPGM